MVAKVLRESWEKQTKNEARFELTVFDEDYVRYLEAMILESFNREKVSSVEEMSDTVKDHYSERGVCPRCHKPNCYSGIAHQNAEAYGGKIFRLACIHCHAPLLVDISRITVLNGIRIGEFTEDDWGTPTKLL